MKEDLRTTMKISSKLLNEIKQSSSFIIAGHINPEGDSIGSSLALSLGLRKMGKKGITVLSRDPVPENLKFLPSASRIRNQHPKKTYDLAILVDCNSIKRTGFDSFNAKRTIIIDHHVLSSEEAKAPFYKTVAAQLIDPEAAAAGILVYKVLAALKVPIDSKIASCLYTAIFIDTGGFRYSNSSPEVLRTSCHLVEAGASPWEISRALYENASFKSMKLLGLSLSTLDRKDGIAWITATEKMFRQTGTSSEDCEDFVDFPRKVQGIKVAIFFREDGKGSCKVSLRSKGSVNVQKIARQFGGGGHVPAAGCKIKGSIKDVQTKVLQAARKAIRES